MRRAPLLALGLVLLAGCGSDGNAIAASGDPVAASASNPTTTLPRVDPLPALGLAYAIDAGTELTALDGTVIDTIAGFHPRWDADPAGLLLADAEHFTYRLAADGTLARATPSPQSLADDEPPPGTSRPDGDIAGHWSARWPGPDGHTRLGYWSGECESPSAWFSTDHGPWRPVVALDDGWPPEGRALGWTPEGQAIVAFTEGICGSAGLRGSGTYLVTPAGELSKLDDRQADAAWVVGDATGAPDTP